MVTITLALMSLCAQTATAKPPDAPDVCFFQKCSGEVRVERAPNQSGDPSRSARTLDRARSGETITVGPSGSAVLIFLSNGIRMQLAGGSKVKVSDGGAVVISGPRPTTRPPINRTLLKPVIQSSGEAHVAGGTIVRGGDDERWGPRSPVPIGSIRSTTPTLKWTGPCEGDGIKIRITCGDMEVLSKEVSVSSTQFVVPEDTLERGKFYEWSVSSYNDSGVLHLTGAVIRVLTSTEAASLREFEAQVAAAAKVSPGDSGLALLLAGRYEALGLYLDAIAQYRQALKLQPGDEGIAAAIDAIQRRLSPPVAPQGDPPPGPPLAIALRRAILSFGWRDSVRHISRERTT